MASREKPGTKTIAIPMMFFPGSRICTQRKSRLYGFTLVELLVVLGVIALLLVALVPALNSFSKSSGRKAAVGNILRILEEARSQAIRDGQATYVVFPDQLPNNSAVDIKERYSYRSFAIFEDDPGTPGTPKQLTPWRTLPTGISIRSGSLGYLANNLPFPFTPLGSTSAGNFPYRSSRQRERSTLLAPRPPAITRARFLSEYSKGLLITAVI